MLSKAEQEQLKSVAIRGRIAFALAATERAFAQFSIVDERLQELVSALWQFVEEDDQYAGDGAWRETRAADDLLEAIDKGHALPESYGSLPPFIARALYDTLGIATAHLYQDIAGYGEESFDLTLLVAALYARHGVALPSLEAFSRLPSTDDGWGAAVPRSCFTTI